MATQIAEAYVQIKPTTKGIKNALTQQMGGDVSSAGESAGQSFGASMVSKLKGVIAAAGIGMIVKEALEAGGAVQQSFGGLETLYGEAADAAKDYAREAAAAGISMNDYAEQAVSFGAGLKQAFDGDTTKAVEAANTAILDMADNAAKMGTPLESIQNAYQGFAKQNYTMLDNLKLGYGGTKQEMERLLADAEKLSGVKYDMENLGDVYAAIHVIQEDLGLTGVAADEAKTTFTGSMQAMKAAAQNFLADLSLGNDVRKSLSTLMESALTFVMDNLLPMVGNIVAAIPTVLSELTSQLIAELNKLSNNLDFSSMFDAGVDFIKELIEGVITNIPYLIEAAVNLAMKFGEALINYDWIGAAKELMQSFRNGMSLASGEIFGSDEPFLTALLNKITESLPEFLEKGKEIITSIIEGIAEAVPQLMQSIGEAIPQVIEFLRTNMPQIFAAIGELINTAISNLPAILWSILELIGQILINLPDIIGAILESLFAFVDSLWGGFYSDMIAAIKEFMDKPGYYLGLAVGVITKKIVEFYKDMITKVKEFFTVSIPAEYNSFKTWLSGIPDQIKGFFTNLPDQLKEIGINAIKGLWNGIKETWDSIKNYTGDLADGVVDGFKGAFKIQSPSKVFRDEVGRWIPEGIAVGIQANADSVTEAMDNLSTDTISAGISGLDFAYNFDAPNSAAVNESGSDEIALLREIKNGLLAFQNMSVVMDTGATVGALAMQMNGALGRIQSREARR